MVSINIDGRYSVTGTNEGFVTCLSTDTKPIGPRSFDGYPKMQNGFTLFELDTQKVYKFDESIENWRFWCDANGGGGGGDVPIATDQEVDEALDDLFAGHD